jgi:hypothetical protein
MRLTPYGKERSIFPAECDEILKRVNKLPSRKIQAIAFTKTSYGRLTILLCNASVLPMEENQPLTEG